MKTKNENEKRETLADIVAEIRAYGAQPPPRLMWLEIADRIEAAWKREKAELIYAYDPTKAGRGHLPDGSAYALEAMREPVTGCHAVGNAAALREALVKIHDKVNSLNEECGVDPVEIRDIARAALSAPARNCDFYDCKTDAETGFVDATGEDDYNPIYWQIFANWLFAPAAERKGEKDDCART